MVPVWSPAEGAGRGWRIAGDSICLPPICLGLIFGVDALCMLMPYAFWLSFLCFKGFSQKNFFFSDFNSTRKR